MAPDAELGAPPAGITERVAGPCPTRASQVSRCAVPDACTFAADAHSLSRLRLRRRRYIALDPADIDVCSIEHRCLLHVSSDVGSRHMLALFGSISRRRIETRNGLLIRGFGVQVPGGSSRTDLLFCFLLIMVADRSWQCVCV